MTAWQQLWRHPDTCEYSLTLLTQRLPRPWVYLGSLSELGERYQQMGRDKFLAKLHRLPDLVLTAIEMYVAKQQDKIAAAERERETAAAWND